MRRSIASLKTVLVLALFSGLLCTQARADDWADIDIHTINIMNMPADRILLRGDDVEIYFKVHNGGTVAASQYTVHLGLYQNLSLIRHKHALGDMARGSLAPDQFDEFTWTLTLPDECPRGTYYIMGRIMCPEDRYPEEGRWKNTSEFKLLEPWPDLTPTTLTGTSGIYLPGADIMLSVSVKNNGGVRADGYAVDFYAGEYGIGRAERGVLERLATDTFQTKCVLPYGMPEGDYTVRVKVSCPADPSPADDEKSGLAVNVRLFSDLAFQSLDISDGTYSPGGQITVRTTIQNAGRRASDKYAVDYYMSSDKVITTRDYHVGSASRGALAVGEQDSFEVDCQLPVYVPQGSWYIGAMIACVNDGNGGNNDRTVDEPVKLVYPPLYVSGRVEYRDVESGPHPLRYALVRICDVGDAEDPLDDRVITETSTGADGGYGVLVPADEQSSQQIYVKVYTQGVAGAYPASASTICIVKDEQHESPYSVKSGLYPYPRTAPLTVNLVAPYAVAGFMVYDSIVEGFHKAKTYFGTEPNEIAVYTPSSDNWTYFDPNSGIHIGNGDRGDRDVIMHEYAHYVAQIRDFAQGDVGDYPQHYWNLDLRFDPSNRTPEHARNLAFREAWATLFSIATQYGDTGYPYSGDTQYQDYDEVAKRRFEIDLETQTKLHSTPGEYFENMNCCALWDIFDDNCDAADNQDTLSDPCLARIWTVMRDDRPRDIKEFWDRWFTRFTSGAEMLRIFRDHGMEFPYVGPSMAVEGFETGDFSGFAWVRFLDQPWVITPDVVHQGGYSARAADISENQKSTLQITMTVDDGPIKYWCKVSSQLGMHKLQFFMDGIKKSELSGDVDWRQISCPVKAGAHTFTWTYVKNGAGAAGADTAWLDDIEFPVW